MNNKEYNAVSSKDYGDFQFNIEENKDEKIFAIKNNDVTIRISSDSFLKFAEDMARAYIKTHRNWFLRFRLPFLILAIVTILFILKRTNIL